MSAESSSSRRSAIAVASSVLLLLDALLIVYVCWYIIFRRTAFDGMFRQFNLKEPLTTWLALNVPNWGVIALGVASFLCLALKELLFRWKSLTLAMNLFGFVAAFVALELFRAAMLQPVLNFIEQFQP